MRFSLSPWSSDCGSSSCHSAASSVSTSASGRSETPSIEHDAGIVPAEERRIDDHAAHDAARAEADDREVMARDALAPRFPPVHPLPAVGVLVLFPHGRRGPDEVLLLGEEVVVCVDDARRRGVRRRGRLIRESLAASSRVYPPTLARRRIDQGTSNPRLLHHPLQLRAEVRRDLVPVLDDLLASPRTIPLATTPQSRHPCPLRSRPCAPAPRAAPSTRSTTWQRRRSLNPRARAFVHVTGSTNCTRRDAAPRGLKIALLQMRRAGRVIADHHVDQPILQRAPQPLAIRALADRRRAFVFGVAVRDRLRIEVQVMRGGLGGERQSLASRELERLQRAGRGEMDDVNARAGVAADAQQQLDRFVLRLVRPRCEIGAVVARRPCFRCTREAPRARAAARRSTRAPSRLRATPLRLRSGNPRRPNAREST